MISKKLRTNPGLWFLIGSKPYKGGYSWYRRQGFEHAVRKSENGWDHYLMWPGHDDDGQPC